MKWLKRSNLMTHRISKLFFFVANLFSLCMAVQESHSVVVGKVQSQATLTAYSYFSSKQLLLFSLDCSTGSTTFSTALSTIAGVD